MKELVGFINGLGHELGRFGQAPPTIKANGAAQWMNHIVEGFDSVESVPLRALHPHFFSIWDESLEGVWAGGVDSSGKPRWVFAARRNTDVQWLDDKMDGAYDALAGASTVLSDKEIAWPLLETDGSDRFLLVKVHSRLMALHVKNPTMILQRHHETLGNIVAGEPHWVLGRASIDIDGAPIPVVNAVKASWQKDWSDRRVGTAILMPYMLSSGVVVQWCALLEEAPRMMLKKQIDELVGRQERVDFFNEKSFLRFLVQ